MLPDKTHNVTNFWRRRKLFKSRCQRPNCLTLSMRTILTSLIVLVFNSTLSIGGENFVSVGGGPVLPVGTVASRLQARTGMQGAMEVFYRVDRRTFFLVGGSYSAFGIVLPDSVPATIASLSTYTLRVGLRHAFAQSGVIMPFADLYCGLFVCNVGTESGNLGELIRGEGRGRFTLGGRLGFGIPVSPALSVQIAGTASWYFIEKGYGLWGPEVGIKYRLDGGG